MAVILIRPTTLWKILDDSLLQEKQTLSGVLCFRILTNAVGGVFFFFLLGIRIQVQIFPSKKKV